MSLRVFRIPIIRTCILGIILIFSLSSFAQTSVHFIDSTANMNTLVFTPDTVVIGKPFYVYAHVSGPAIDYIFNFANDDSDYYGTLNDNVVSDTVNTSYVFTEPGSTKVIASAHDRHGNLIGSDTTTIVAIFGNISSPIVGKWFVIGFFDQVGNGHVAHGDTLTFFSDGRYAGSSGLPRSAQRGAWTGPEATLIADSSKKMSSIYESGDTLTLSDYDTFQNQAILQIFFKSLSSSVAGITPVPIQLNITPNPIFSESTITFLVPRSDFYSILISDMAGRSIPIISNQFFEKGLQSIHWSPNSFVSGLYKCQMLGPGFQASSSCIILR